MKTITELQQSLLSAVHTFSSIGIVTHEHPDGDGLPACLALKLLFQEQNIESTIVLEEIAADMFDFLQAKEHTSVLQADMQFDLIILVDCHEQKRIGKCEILVDRAKMVITIDHHPPGSIIDDAITYFDVDMVCVGAIIYQLFSAEIQDMTKDVQNELATLFYTTILNDTDHFMNANVDVFTFQFCADLMHYGLNPGDITQAFLYKKKPVELRFIGETLATIQLELGGKVLFIHSTLEMLERNELTNAATTKLTRWVKGAENVLITVYYREMGQGKYRLSLRSNFINVNKIAIKYNGGGHIKASGCEVSGTLAEVKEIILSDIREQLA